LAKYLMSQILSVKVPMERSLKTNNLEYLSLIFT
jgi:hypothetical protein